MNVTDYITVDSIRTYNPHYLNNDFSKYCAGEGHTKKILPKQMSVIH